MCIKCKILPFLMLQIITICPRMPGGPVLPCGPGEPGGPDKPSGPEVPGDPCEIHWYGQECPQNGI